MMGGIEESFYDKYLDFQDEYQGQYDDEEDFYYKQFARDLFMCDYWFDDGFVFWAA